MSENTGQPTNQDIMTAISDFAGHVEERFEKVEERFEKVEKRFEKVEKRFEKIETGITTIKATMVTKEYLDEKMADLRGDMVVLMRKEDTKLKSLVEILLQKKVISDSDVTQIMKMEPFAQLTL